MIMTIQVAHTVEKVRWEIKNRKIVDMMVFSTGREVINNGNQKTSIKKNRLWHMISILRKIEDLQNPEEAQILTSI